MKQINTRWTGWIAVTVMLAGFVILPAAEAANGCRTCRDTARYAYWGDWYGIRDDYYIEIGKAINISDFAERWQAFRQAADDFVESTEEAVAVYYARRDLCTLLMECGYDPDIDPDDFKTPEEAALSPNPFFPLIPGTVCTFESETDEGTETIVVEVTHVTKEIMDVSCIEVRDTVSLGGELVEDTLDWYAVHQDGSVWYFGEISFNYEDGEVADLEGSWKAGENGAKPGIVMLSNPQVGDAYRQEWLLGEAEDAAEVLGLNETIVLSDGTTYNGCVKTLDLNPHDPGLVEHKYYAPGIGFVYEIKPDEGETVELKSKTP